VDPISIKSALTRVGPINGPGAPSARQPEQASAARADALADTRRAAREMAARPPVDADRVAEIRRALEEGRFPITPAKIADRLIAAQMLWARRDEQD